MAAEFMGQALESRIRYVFEALKRERKRYEEFGPTPVPPWLDSCIYQVEIGISDLEGSRIAARTLKATVEEILEIVDHEHGGGCGASSEIRKRFKALLRRSDEG